MENKLYVICRLHARSVFKSEVIVFLMYGERGRVTQTLDKERSLKEQIYFEVLYASFI